MFNWYQYTNLRYESVFKAFYTMLWSGKIQALNYQANTRYSQMRRGWLSECIPQPL